ncbi:McrB family protein [Clostridium botulinum]|uniref:McrB family protein n=1 Tax=Clostridium botulinum TaxID=1491 RepID=UPI00096D9D01|nr:AAA family ATPase [Clostridium botulinum]
MAYTAKDASKTLFRYLNITEQSIKFIENTHKRGFIYNTASGEQCVIFIYPISHKADDSKNFFDTRDSGAYERGVSWNYSLENKLKYFCVAVHDQVEKYNDYIFSLECQEKIIEKVSGTLNGARVGTGTQVVIPNDYIPNNQFERILTKNGFFIAVIHKDNIIDYIDKYDNRPYLIDDSLVELGEPETNDEDLSQSVDVHIGDLSKFSPNRILFGAPGTGKSYKLNEDREGCFTDDNYERVTFHPSYSYAQFVGTYKPTPKEDDDSVITYKYIPGPFMRVWVRAYRSMQNNDGQNYLLIIEEINRANVAAVFGDVFQLLDRKDWVSEYSIYTSEDIKRYLNDEFSKEIPENEWYRTLSTAEKKKHINSIKLPSNMYIWSTMNSADQGVFPIDTAFKRRWNFEYIGINESESMNDIDVTFADGRVINWNVLRHAINEKLGKMHINEDKMIGPFFLSKDDLKNNFEGAFKSKLLMYLYEDVIKHRRDEFFAKGMDTYSKLLEAYEKIGGDVFMLELEYIPIETQGTTVAENSLSNTISDSLENAVTYEIGNQSADKVAESSNDLATKSEE